MKRDPELEQNIKIVGIDVVIALFLVMIAIGMGPIISFFVESTLSTKVTDSEATSYFIQALLAVVIAFVPFKYRQAKE